MQILGNDAPDVTFLKPVGGEAYPQSNQVTPDCLAVEFVVAEGSAEVESYELGYTNAAKTKLSDWNTGWVPVPDGGHVEECIKTPYAGDELLVYVRLFAKPDKEYLFYSPAVKVDLPMPSPPWQKMLIVPGQGPLPKTPSDQVSISSVFFSGLHAIGDELILVKTYHRKWGPGADLSHEISSWLVHLDLESLEVVSEDSLLEGFDEESGFGVARYDTWLINVSVAEKEGSCQADTCDYVVSFRDVSDGAPGSWSELEMYEDRKADEKPAVHNYDGGAMIIGGTRIVVVRVPKSGQSSKMDIFKHEGGGWSKVGTLPFFARELMKLDGDLWAISETPATDDSPHVVTASRISLDDGSLLEQNDVISSSSPNFAWQAKGTPDGDTGFVVGQDLDESKLIVVAWQDGDWVELPPVILPESWRGLAVGDWWLNPITAAKDTLFFGVHTHTKQDNKLLELVVPLLPDEEPDLDLAFTDVSTQRFNQRKTIGLEGGSMVRIPLNCEWNLGPALCLQASAPGEDSCWDGDICTEDIWDPVAGQCAHMPTVCEQDGDACNGPEVCNPQTGLCGTDLAGAVICDDGIFCNGPETCDPTSGDCVLNPVPGLDDGRICTVDTCSEDSGDVIHTADDDNCVPAPCFLSICDPINDDADKVTGCVDTPIPIEPDGLDCTDDLCDPATGKTFYIPLDDFCVLNGLCYAAGESNPASDCHVCEPTEDHYQWSLASDGVECDDGFFCTVDGHCAVGSCVGVPRDCLEALTDELCQKGVCDEQEDSCAAKNVLNGTSCDVDGDACNGLNSCQDGLCEVAGPPTVDDANPCTDDSCIAESGVVHEFNSASCNVDDDGCTQDQCIDGNCEAGLPPDCSDLTTDCLEGLCQSTGADSYECVADASQKEGVPCDDGDLCTDDGACADGACVPGPAKNCSDDDPCTDDICNPEQGCVNDFNSAPCDDGDPCTGNDICADGLCAGTPMDVCCDKDEDCVDADPCTVGVCEAGQCSYAPGNDGAPCEDELLCTEGEECKDGLCVGTELHDCSDISDECSTGVCATQEDQCLLEPKPKDTPCGPGSSCKDGVVTFAQACDGAGTCIDSAGEASCEPFAVCKDEFSCATECDDDDDCIEGLTCLEKECRTNGTPVADAGSDQIVDEQAEVTLDGRDSVDPDGDELTFAWTQTEGPTVDLDSAQADTPVFVSPAVTETTFLSFELVVSDGFEESAPSGTSVVVKDTVNESPTANAGESLIVNEGDQVKLDGTQSTDPNGDPLTYHWSQEGTPAVEPSDWKTPELAFLAPEVAADVILTFKLVVNDGQSNSVPDEVTVMVRNVATKPEAAPELTLDIMALPDLSEVASSSDAIGGEEKKVAGSSCAASSTGEHHTGLPALLLALLLSILLLRRRNRGCC